MALDSGDWINQIGRIVPSKELKLLRVDTEEIAVFESCFLEKILVTVSIFLLGLLLLHLGLHLSQHDLHTTQLGFFFLKEIKQIQVKFVIKYEISKLQWNLLVKCALYYLMPARKTPRGLRNWKTSLSFGWRHLWPNVPIGSSRSERLASPLEGLACAYCLDKNQ